MIYTQDVWCLKSNVNLFTIMKKILNVVSVYFSVPFFFGDQIGHFINKGYDVHLACSPSEKLAEYAKKQGCKAFEVDLPRQVKPWTDIKSLVKLYKYIKREKFDVVCGHTFKGGVQALIASYLARTPQRVYFRHGTLFETAHGIKRFILILIERFISKLSTKVVCVSPFLVELSTDLRLTRPEKLVLLNHGSCNGIDASKLYNPKHIDKSKLIRLREQYHLQDTDRVIGFVGRLVIDKGIVELVNAFEELKNKYKNIKLLLVGPFERRNAVPHATKDVIEKDNDILFVGEVDSTETPYYYSLMDVMVLCTHREGFGSVIIEAQAMEVPVLTTSHTGSRDAICENETGMYVIKGDSSSIVNQLSRYFDEPELLQQHKNNCRGFVISNFSPQLVWKDIESKIYNT